MLLENLFILILAYLIGSINPAYVLGRLRGIDIRKYGRKTAGASNAFRVLGKPAGIIAGIFDFAKGILILMLAYKLAVPEIFIFTAGIFVILGHIFPFYMQFKGGKGAATCYGLLVFCFYNFIKEGMPLPAFLILIFFSIVLMIILNSGNAGMLITSPTYLFLVYYYIPFSKLVFFATILLVYMIALDISIVAKYGIAPEIRPKKVKIKIWRKILRFATVIFPALYFFFSKNILLYVLISVTLFFVFIDFWKIKTRKKVFGFLYKVQEKGISNITLFLIGSLVVILFFEKNIAIISLLFLTIGDNTAEIIGLKFGKFKLIGKKTLEGSLASLASCILVGLIVMNPLNFTLLQIIIAAFATTIIEIVPLKIGKFKIDDNLSVGIFTAIALTIIKRAGI